MRFSFGLMIVFSLMIVASLVYAEPFAPKVHVPQEMLDPTHPDALDAMMAKNSKIPSKQEVGLPAYQGAKVMHTQQPSGAQINGKELQPNHMVRMGTADPIDRVRRFYREQLSDWSSTESFGTHILYQGEGKFELMHESSMITPHVQIREAYPQESPLMPEMSTVIEIYYRP